ncbi:DUF6157 family protein [Pedobacter xixiisoli]|uniref:Uncharacterized protein n=1 Tax=Pedobacter xixiisoli TaxID=1476464 RepID=A0A286A0R8_9SPHI|nr:DUF6157 family protein [Pedobacter xixiisoli]SOD15493.1 hypothetical protein SAMN06297358_2487 [Pedobacter xixiisoli]
MKIHTTNYQNTFIAIADDSNAARGEIPAEKADLKTLAGWQFDIISNNPYQYNSDDVLFLAHALQKDLLATEFNKAKAEFFSKGQACLRASALGKRYGWGIHHDAEGKIAIYGCETPAYQDFLNQAGIKVVKAMRSKR